MLESQAVRATSRRAYMYRRPRRVPRMAMLAAAAAVTAAGWAGWNLLGPADGSADAVPAPAPGPAPATGAPGSETARITQGARAPGARTPPPATSTHAAAPRTTPTGNPASRTPAPRKAAAPTRPPETPRPQRSEPEPAPLQEGDPAPAMAAASGAPMIVNGAPLQDAQEPRQADVPDISPAAPAAQQALARDVTPIVNSPSPAPAPAPLGAAAADAVRTRRELSAALHARGVSPADAEQMRRTLSQINERLVFGPEVADGDPFALVHVVQSGEQLAQIVRREAAMVHWKFIQRINRITDARNVRVGQALKVVRGPFHAVVSKRDFRMDLYLGEGSDRIYVRSFTVGLGELNSTPTGLFRIRPSSKLEDPAWVNPRTRQSYAAGDPANPIGEYWLGLEGLEDHNGALEGYGIHGTIEPESIGTQASMGCVRMLPRDVEVVYEMLVEGDSTVFIQP